MPKEEPLLLEQAEFRLFSMALIVLVFLVVTGVPFLVYTRYYIFFFAAGI